MKRKIQIEEDRSQVRGKEQVRKQKEKERKSKKTERQSKKEKELEW